MNFTIDFTVSRLLYLYSTLALIIQSKMSSTAPSYWKYVTNNKSAVKQSSKCSCICCNETYKASKVTNFTSDNCAMCPVCWVDAVVPHNMIVPTKEQMSMWYKEGFACTSDSCSSCDQNEKSS